MNIENRFINAMCQKNTRIGDDGAVIGNYVYSKDIFFENIHFKRAWLTPYQIGYKAMIINISDAIAMNAIPRYALIGAAMPKSMRLEEMDELSRGMKECADRYGIEIIGGDTISNTKLDLSITVVSTSSHPLLRKGLKNGDLIAYTGNIGGSLRQLRYLMAGGKAHSKSRFILPVLRNRFVSKARPFLRCGMDISDGLYSDMGKLCSMNRMGIHWNHKFAKQIGCSGEEYEMLFGFSPRHLRALKRISKLARTPIHIVGKARRGKFINRCKAHHF